eukprot:1205955-Prymnesium_polylepis.1
MTPPSSRPARSARSCASQRGDPPKVRGPQHSLSAPCHPRTGPGRTHRTNGRTHSAPWGRIWLRRLSPHRPTMGELPHASRPPTAA